MALRTSFFPVVPGLGWAVIVSVATYETAAALPRGVSPEEAGAAIDGMVHFPLPLLYWPSAVFPDTNFRSCGSFAVTTTLVAAPGPLLVKVSTNVPSPTKPVEGKNMTFVLTLTNNGPGAATNVVVTAKLPQDLKFVSAKTADGRYSNGSGKWTIPSIAAPASSGLTPRGRAAAASYVATLTITAQPRPGTTGKKLVFKAKVTASDQFDPTSNNNTGSAAVNVKSASTGGGGGGSGTGGGGTAFTGSNVDGVMATDLSLLVLGLGAVIAGEARRRSAKTRVILGVDDMGDTWAC